ncbi:MAG: nucleotide-binding protein [Neisseriaceae bacterium]|nr:nucleotide-binding protein [Neisseriaceae bacterium]
MTTNNPKKIDLSKIFIVHGRDNELKQEVARFIENLGFKAIILHEQANKGQTIIQKFEANSDVGYAIILYTPCDEGRIKGGDLQSRARQNVVFEHGYFMAKLGADKVCLLRKGDVERPNDIQGLTYHDIDGDTWKVKVAQELKEAGYDVDMNKLLFQK